MYLLHLLVPGVHMGGGGVVATLPCPYYPDRTDFASSASVSIPSSLVADSVRSDYADTYASSVNGEAAYGGIMVAASEYAASAVEQGGYSPAMVGEDSAWAVRVDSGDGVQYMSVDAIGSRDPVRVDGSEAQAVAVSVSTAEYVPTRGGSCCCD